jgi:glutamyl-tRNA reductase
MCPSGSHPLKQEPAEQEDVIALDSEPRLNATIALLKHHLELVRICELKRVRGRLGQLSSTQENAIESLTCGIVDEILRAPVTVLRAVEDNDFLAVIQTVHRIFNLGQRQL